MVETVSGVWKSLKSLRKPKQADKGRFRDKVGKVVGDDEKAEALG